MLGRGKSIYLLGYTYLPPPNISYFVYTYLLSPNISYFALRLDSQIFLKEVYRNIPSNLKEITAGQNNLSLPNPQHGLFGTEGRSQAQVEIWMK